MKLWQVIKDFLYKDVISENESKKAAVILRFTAIIMCCYFLIMLCCYLFNPHRGLLCAIPCCFLMGFSFYFTYEDRTRLATGVMNTTLICWILLMVRAYGWDSGVQHFIFALLVLYFMTSAARVRTKVAYSVFLCILRLGMFWYTLTNRPSEPLTAELLISFQVINTLIICLMIVMLLLLYTKDSRQMEEKLIVYNENLKRLASRDPLTRLRNRRAILEYLEEKADCYKKGKYNSLSVAIADIDFFKKVNDIYGHECGDLVLKKVAEVFEEFMKDIGIVGRWGGEEFLFVFKDRNGDEAYEDLLRLQRLVKGVEIPYNEEQLKITLTYGLTEYDCNKEIDLIIKEADEKLYMGKKSGRNRIVF